MAGPHLCLDCQAPLANPRAQRCRSCAAKARGMRVEIQRAGGWARQAQLAEQKRLAALARAAGLG